MRLDGFLGDPLPRVSQARREAKATEFGKGFAMATASTFGDAGSRVAPAMGALPIRARPGQCRRARRTPRQTARAFMLGLDDATLATFGYDRMSVDHAGRAGFPL